MLRLLTKKKLKAATRAVNKIAVNLGVGAQGDFSLCGEQEDVRAVKEAASELMKFVCDINELTTSDAEDELFSETKGV